MSLGREFRDEGFQRLELHGPDFTAAVFELVSVLEAGRLLTGEDIRKMATTRGLFPHHSNAWGGAVNSLVRSGRLVATGRYVQMSDPRSHARETKLYRIEALS